jgi:hypothetical protein
VYPGISDPETGGRLNLGPYELLTLFTDADAYVHVPIINTRPTLTLCLAHFAGARDWEADLDDPWNAGRGVGERSWSALRLRLRYRHVCG